MGKYKPATFQPTVRPDWGGILSYIPESEKASILEAIIKYPSVDCDSPFWLETIKPDLDLQYEEFTRQCEAKSRGVRNRWAKTSITPLIDKNKTSIRGVIVSEGIGEEESKGIEEGKSEGIEEGKSEVKPKKNKKPTLEEIKSYAQSRNRLDLAEKFYDYYQATDWKDKENRPVKNWKAKFITWENHNAVKKTGFGSWESW